MKKTLFLLLIAVATGLISIAAYTERIYQPGNGFKAPTFDVPALTDSATVMSLKDMRGQYILLSFWSSSDPASRMQNMTYDGMTRRLDRSLPAGHKPLKFVSINFDTSRNLVEQIARRDSLNPSDIGHAEGITARRLITDYRLADGYRAYLIDPLGNIIARNPSAATLAEVIK